MIKLILLYEDSLFSFLTGKQFVEFLLEYLEKTDIIGHSKQYIINRDGKFVKSKEQEYVTSEPIQEIKNDIMEFISQWISEIQSLPDVKSVRFTVSPYFGFSNYIHIKLNKPNNSDLLGYYNEHKGQYQNCHFKFTDHIQRKTPYRDEIGQVIRDQVDYSNKSFEEASSEMKNKICEYIQKLHEKEQNYLLSLDNNSSKNS